MVLLAAETVGALAAQLGTGEEADAALLVRDDAGRPLPSGAVRLAIVDPTPKRLGIARKIVAQGKRWLGRNDIWFSPTPRLGAAGGLVALVFPGVEPVFDPRVDDIAPWFGWDAIEERDTSQLGHQGRAIVDVGRLLHRALAELGVRADHLAGHSIGEWTGMVASELIPSDRADEFIDSIDPGALEVPGVIFAAMGCGADVSAELIDGLPDVVISHDNCPHQSILCGAEASVREALDRARARKVIGQELPFRSGFHSPMFAPFLEPIRVHLDQMPVQAPSTPLWSATLADRYPTDDGEVRDLVIRHLLEPVRFQPLLRRLADEGVRAVVQLGVGSLVGFVDDTFPIGNPETGALLAVPATTPKREGLDQLRRVLAGLWSEGLDTVRFDRLPTGPDTATALTSAPAVDKPAGAMLSLGAPFVRLTDSGIRLTPVTPGAADRAATNLAGSADPVLAELGAMLAETSRAGDELLALLDGSAPARTPAPFAATTPSGSVPAAAPAQADEPADAPVIERTATVPVSVDAMPWLLDHCFYRQPAGWPHAEDRFPVVPMTALIEILVEQAEALVPGRVAVAVNEIRALRWTAVAPATELTVKAKRTGESSDGIEVRVTIEGYARGTVVLAPAHPAPPAPDQTPLTGEVPSAVDAHQLYADRWMFHGPEYQGVTRLGPIASDGIDGVITTPAAPGALLDNAGQLMGYWMMQAAELDRLALPMTVGSVRFFGAHPTAGTDVTCRVWIDEVTDDGIRTHMELTVEGDGGAPVVWCRIADWYDKRFDSDDVVWPLFQHPEHRDLAEEQDGGWVLVRERWRSTASRELMVRRYTDAAERADYDRRNPRDQRQWLLGRIAAKDAVRRSVWGGAAPDARAALFPIEAGIDHLPSGQPIVTAPPAMAGRPLSIAHTDGLAVAMVGAPGGAVGIDVERIDARTPRFADLTLTATEQALVGPDDAALTTAWTVKEAAAKAAGSGLEGRPKQFQISSIDGSHFVVATPDGPRRLDTTTIRTPEGDFVVAWTLSDD